MSQIRLLHLRWIPLVHFLSWGFNGSSRGNPDLTGMGGLVHMTLIIQTLIAFLGASSVCTADEADSHAMAVRLSTCSDDELALIIGGGLVLHAEHLFGFWFRILSLDYRRSN